MHGQIQDWLVFHQFYTSKLLSFIVLIFIPVNCILCIWQYFSWMSCLITTVFAAHEGWTLSLQKFLRLTKQGWNAYNLYIWQWQSKLLTDIPLAVDRYSANNQWPAYRPSAGSDIDQYVDCHSADISVDTSTDIFPSLYRPRVGRCVDQHTGRHSPDMSTDTSVECWSICQPIYRSRSTQNTHDPVTELLIEKTWGRGCVIFGKQKDKRAKWWNSFENGLRPRWITPS